MSPRRKAPRAGRSDRRPQPRDVEKAFGHQRIESAPDGDWIVRSVAGAGSGKTYRCPGCDQ
ncbi:MAG TPA: ATP/GTP-binding protein, partial [Thermoleophilia bacterium]|nr:ATP/GTP-binding protein [Thermoleophilia bacterium]